MIVKLRILQAAVVIAPIVVAAALAGSLDTAPESGQWLAIGVVLVLGFLAGLIWAAVDLILDRVRPPRRPRPPA